MVKKIPDPIDIHVGGRVRSRRLDLGMSQVKLADAVGLTFQQVQKYEKGTNRMGSSRLQQVASALKVPVTFFFEEVPGQPKFDGKASSTKHIYDFLATSDGRALARAFMRLSNTKLRRSIVEFVANIAVD